MIKMTRVVGDTELSVELQPPYVQAMADYLTAERMLQEGLPASKLSVRPPEPGEEAPAEAAPTPEKKKRSPRKPAPSMFPEDAEEQAEPVEEGEKEHEVAEALATKRAAEDLAKAEAEAKAKADAEDTPTADDLRAALQKFIQTNGAAAGKAFLTNAGYTKVSDVPADAITDLIAAMEL